MFQVIFPDYWLSPFCSQIDVEQKAATSKLNDEMRKMRKSLLPSVDKDGNSKKRYDALVKWILLTNPVLSNDQWQSGQTMYFIWLPYVW